MEKVRKKSHVYKITLSNKIEFDILEKPELTALLRSAKKLLNRIISNPQKFGNIWVDIHKVKKNEVSLIILPMERVGAEKGFCGSNVMIGYFISEGIKPSRPMVIKILKQSKYSKPKDKLKDEDERFNKIKLWIKYSIEYFSAPIHFSTHKIKLKDKDIDCSLLWFHFISNKIVGDLNNDNRFEGLAEKNLLKVLRQPNDYDLKKKIIDNLYQFLKDLHCKENAKPKKRNILKEYSWYLRGINSEQEERWKKVWIYHDSSNSYVREFGKTWANPFMVLEKLRECKFKLFFGGIHGDLHPRNVVLGLQEVPFLIDYGWSSDDSHIAKDFVLMEANLRFAVLRPEVSFYSILKMSDWIKFERECKFKGDSYIENQIKLIQHLRSIAKQHFSNTKNINWDEEYIIPLFITSFGLLRHIKSFDNQTAARITVLALATYIKKNIFSNL
jgi:hypothetical protein